MATSKHLTLDDRIMIQQLLNVKTSLTQIALSLGKSTSTISREIRSRSVVVDKGAYGRLTNRCIHRGNCQLFSLCPQCDKPKHHKCSSCSLCNSRCGNFEEVFCPDLNKSPYVCNGCSSLSRCVLKKRFYQAKQAQSSYESILSLSRQGANISELELSSLDQFISPLISSGQAPYAVLCAFPDRFSVSAKTVYRYIDSGLLSAKNYDLPRKCRLKPRSSKPIQHKVDRSCRIGRTFSDYISFINRQDPLSTVQMDSVIGSIGGKCLLTFSFECGLLLAFLRDRNDSFSVIQVFDELFVSLGSSCFSSLFPIILTDNGSEFSNPGALEFSSNLHRRTRIFYCDPQRSDQKGRVEVAHEMIRRVLPKGSSFDSLSQSDIDLLLSHINSYPRNKLNGRSPWDAFSSLYGESILLALGLRKIPAVDIDLTPSLLSR